MAGLDPGGNLRGAIQTTARNDFQPGGLLDSTNAPYDLNFVWRANCADIHTFLHDWHDNGHIDYPGAAVYDWPGQGSSYTAANTGFELPYSNQGLAGFFDENEDGIYDPNAGDYPSIEVRGCPLNRFPDDMGWFDMNDNHSHASGLPPLQLEVQTQIMAYRVTSLSSLVNNTIYVRYKLIYRGSEPLDSCYFGAYTDFSIGDDSDDFAGSNPARNLLYAYNGDQGGFGAEAPVMVADMLRGPLDSAGNILPVSHLMIVNDADNLQGLEYYRLLTGHFADGTPAPNGGVMYPGAPLDPAGNSEVTAGNTPGHRAGLASYGPFNLRPGAVNELIVAYYYVFSPQSSILEDVQSLYQTSAGEVQALFDNCFAELPNQVCNAVVEAPEAHSTPEELRVYPSPASDAFTVESTGEPFRRIEITDLLGRSVQRIDLDGALLKHTVDTGNWPAGVYAVRVGSREKTVSVLK